MKRLIELLHSEGCSCVIESQGEIRAFRQRGVADLYDLYQNERDFMQNAQLADKVIGKGAAALIVLGKMKEVYADIISTPALSFVTSSRNQNLVRKRSAIYHQSCPDRKMSAGITLCRSRHGRRNLSDNRKICSTNKN
mgnify:FL=1